MTVPCAPEPALVLAMPVYNEGSSAPRALEAAVEAAEALGRPWRVVVYDDGSTDDTGWLDRRTEADPRVRTHRLPSNQGVGAFFAWCTTAALDGLDDDATFVVLEGDGTSDLDVLPGLVEAVDAGADVAVASRFVDGGRSSGFPLRKRLVSYGVNLMLRGLYAPRVGDWTMFYRAYRVGALRAAAPLATGRFTANAEILVRLVRAGARVAEVPQHYRYDQKVGASKLRVLSHVGELARLIRAVPPRPGSPGRRTAGAGAEPTPPTSSGRPHLHAILMAALLGLGAALTLPGGLLPAWTSPDGLLERVPPGDDSLSSNHARLVVPPGQGAWSEISLVASPRVGEAVTVLLDRSTDGFWAVRLSRVAPLDSAILRFGSGELLDKRALELGDRMERADAIPVRIRREPDRFRIEIDGAPPIEVDRIGTAATHVDGTGAPLGPTEVALFPPHLSSWERRIRVSNVQAGGDATTGRGLGVRPALVAVAIVLIVAAIRRRWLGRLPDRAFPHAAARAPAAVTSFLLCLVALLGVGGLVGWFSPFGHFTRSDQARFATLVVAASTWHVLWMVLVDRGIAPRARRPSSVVLATLATFVAGLLVFQLLWTPFVLTHWVRRPVPDVPARGIDDASHRVVVYGGSTTRGYPFPHGWPGAFPQRLEALLREAGLDAHVYNQGMEAYDIENVRRMVKRNRTALQGSTVVVNSVVNNAVESPARLRRYLTQIAGTLERADARLYLVREPTIGTSYFLDQAHDPDAWPTLGDHYAVLDELAQRPDVHVIDPNPTLHAHRDGFLFMDSVHLAPMGHQRVAEVLAAAITSEPDEVAR